MADNPQPDQKPWVLVSAVLASSMAFIDATALNVVLPSIQSQFSATGIDLLWIVNAYSVVTAALILFGGALGDEFGRKRVFGMGIVIFTAASLGCALATEMGWLINMRALQGVGAGLMIPGSLALIATAIPASRRGRAIGIWSACSVVMTALGPILGGCLGDWGWWSGIFLINLPIGLLALIVLCWKVSLAPSFHPSDEPRVHGPAHRRIDYFGAGFSIAGLAAINIALLQSVQRGWNDRFILINVLVGVVCLILFLMPSSRRAAPLLPLAMFRNRNFSLACQMTLCFYSGIYAMLFLLALNLIQVQQYSATIAGAAQLPVMLLVMVIAPLAGRFVDRRGARIALLASGTLAIAGFLMLAIPGVTKGAQHYWTTFFPSLCCLGMAMGIGATTLSTAIMNTAQESRFGTVSGINSTLSRLASVFGISILGSIAILVFRRSLVEQTQSIPRPERWSEELFRQSWKLAETSIPSGLSLQASDAIERAIAIAFVDAFRTVTLIAALIVGCSTLVTVLFWERDHAFE